MEIHADILETMGNTPLVALRRFHPQGALLAAKVEYFNPGSSVKDRIGPAMIEAGERSGALKPGGTIVEPTSGNTGVGLAMAANLKGYKLVCTAADKIPKEKIALLEAFGAKVITCPTNVEADDPRSYYKTAERIRDEEGAYLPYQYYNQANPQAHYETTGPEVWRQTDGRITHWVVGVGTGGTISGAAKYLKEQNPAIRVVGVDTVGSVYAYYKEHGALPPAEQIHQYLIDGIGEDFMPGTVWWDYIDEIVTVDDRERLPRHLRPGAQGVDLRRLLLRRRRRRRPPGGPHPPRRRDRRHPLPRLGRALPLEAQRRVAAGEGAARGRLAARHEKRRGRGSAPSILRNGGPS